jgi:hypothetical protein
MLKYTRYVQIHDELVISKNLSSHYCRVSKHHEYILVNSRYSTIKEEIDARRTRTIILVPSLFDRTKLKRTKWGWISRKL